jgi:DNA primase
VAEAWQKQPQFFDGLGIAAMLGPLCERGAAEPLAALTDPVQRGLLAQSLLHEVGEVELEQVEAALKSLTYHRLQSLQRQVRADIAEAERRGDKAQLALCIAEKMRVDREMKEAGL